jgi:succinate dehydrogenase / fumarate reductase cytochrome b subunit
MSLTGMGLSLFLLLHVAGNLMILADAQKYNEYSHMLISNPLLLPAEFGLILLVALHIYTAIRLSRRNQTARPVAYEIKSNTGRSRRWFGSSNMGITGTIILAFIVYHIIHFKYNPHIPTIQNEIKMRDLATLVKGEFHEGDEVFIYVVAMVVIMLHLLHGIRSMWESLGVATTVWDKFFLWMSRIFVVGVMGGFILIPLAIYFRS